MSRRSYFLSLVACLAGAGLALYAITRTWSVHLTPRTGMSALRDAKTGTDLAPWVTGLAVVALAGTGALLATSGWLRRVVGVLLSLAGVGVVAGAIAGRAGLDPGAATGGTAWPVVCVIGGAIIMLSGVTAARQGHRWPRMSARYDRKPVPLPRSGAGGAATGRPRDKSSTVVADHRAAWDALDRGDDPTAG
ncbi:Trp biosynthesis-associated membrane protein [Actinoplanes subtropicus]|uniref:Trp biosynthesis-associated membrane protein n=1 Tax=Actinoplanes subtropicus TaxID=543632 RepID=UPI0004C3C1BC|nr:Trp biosynthesis-associated membrane protein [Actinoplanes subtropicus]